MKTNLLCLIFLFYCGLLFGQTEFKHKDEQQKQVDLVNIQCLNDKARAQQNLLINEKPTSSPNLNNQLKSLLVDEDDDGMEDDWENSNGLNPDDPKDAFGDLDGDHILNLFEFQLQTDPNSFASPAVYEMTPNQDFGLIGDLVDESEGDLRVIRMSEGEYYGSILGIFDENFRVMIQGGWNADFTEYNPAIYQTNWSFIGNECIKIITSPNSEGITYSAVVFDGINFQGENYFFLGGVARVSNGSENSVVGINNCSFTNSEFYGFSSTHKNNCEYGEVFIINTLFGNNLEGGVYTQATDEANVRWRFFNTTINNPNALAGGFDGFASGNAVVTLEFVNSINWGNTAPAINLTIDNDFQLVSINSNIGDLLLEIDTLTYENSFNQDPLFSNAADNDWTLMDGSPCINSGIDIGLPFGGSAPEMGAFEIFDNTDLEDLAIATFQHPAISPNPSAGAIVINLDETRLPEHLEIFNFKGQSLWQHSQIEEPIISMDLTDFPSGIYLLKSSYFHKGQSISVFDKFVLH